MQFYICSLSMLNYLSYKEQTVIEPFSPKTNVIVGRNGSGKSNFFAAIRFVLSDAYTQMGREERQALLHEGSGSAVMSAYVEIIFDNSDDRFPTGKDELILRRTIGVKKDEYSLDRKNATKTDVMNLLESAGFSRSNPYYIVPQGRVTTLTNMKDAERLNLLKEVAGTQVYEARRTESLKIMTETNNKRAKIDETLDYIKERLNELEDEMKELRAYQEKDKERRCLEYAFYHREQTALQNALDEIDQARTEGVEGTEENRDEFLEGERQISELADEIKQLRRQMELLKLERRTLEEDRRDASKTQAKCELNVKTLTDGLSASEEARTRHQQELKAVKDEISSKEAELAKILPEYTKQKKNENEVKQNLDACESTRQRLYNKQGRGVQFKSKAERDNWLRNEIQELNTALGEQKANRMDADEEVKVVQKEIQSLEGEIAGLRQRLEGWSGSRQALSDEVANAKDALEKLDDERKVLRRDEDRLESLIQNARQEKDRAEKELSYTMDGATSRGLATLRRLKQDRNIEGAYGTLAELLDCDELYRTAVEQTAGNNLFSYVVDNADTATQLGKALYDQHGGRITFIPLSNMKQKPAKLPKANDAQPLISKITFDKKFKPAMEHVFGRTIVCPNLTVAGQYSRSHGCDAITPEGDTQNRKGAMTGGYIDSRKSRLQAVRAVNKWRDECESLRQQAREIQRSVERKHQEITAVRSELQKLDQNLKRYDDGLEPLKAELRGKASQLEKQKDQLEANLQRKENVERLLKEHGDNISGLEAEMASDFKRALTASEERQLEQLNTTIQDLHKQWNDISNSRRELESRKKRLEVDLRENLRLKLDNLNSQEIGTDASGGSGDLKEAQRELKRAQKAVANIDAKLNESETQIEEAESKISSLEKDKARREERQNELARAIEKQQKRTEKSIQKRAILTARLQDCTKNIRDLGVLPDEAFERFSKTESDKVSMIEYLDKTSIDLTLDPSTSQEGYRSSQKVRWSK
jgi:structural maintenance of chromosome 3 (chondroitin sulfate proteoglycan 6)